MLTSEETRDSTQPTTKKKETGYMYTLYIHKRPGGYISTKYVYIKLDAMASQKYIYKYKCEGTAHSTEKHKIRPQNIKWTPVTFVLKRQKLKKKNNLNIFLLAEKRYWSITRMTGSPHHLWSYLERRLRDVNVAWLSLAKTNGKNNKTIKLRVVD